MSIDENKRMLEDIIKQLEEKNLELSEMEDKLTEEEFNESEICAKIKEDIDRLECEITKLEVQKKSTIQSEVNPKMLEYSQKKDDPMNFALCSSLQNQAADIFYRNFESLIRTAARYYNWRGTREDYEDAVQTALLDSFGKYDSKKNNNFCAWFYLCLLRAVQNALKKEIKKTSYKDENGKNQTRILDKVDWPTQKDDEGNETLVDMPDPNGDVESAVDTHLIMYEHCSKMMTCVLKVRENREDYGCFACFATSFYIWICRAGYHRSCNINENEAFSTMDTKFADYTLLKQCRSFEELSVVHCKNYSDLNINPTSENNIPKALTGELEVPFRNHVYMQYLGISYDTVANQKHKFKKETRVEDI